MSNMEEQDHRIESSDEDYRSPLKLLNSRDDATTFLPLDFRIGSQNRDGYSTVGQYLTRDQAKYVYKKVETGETINTDMIQQEIEQEKQLDRMDDGYGEINPYRELIVNNAEKAEPINDTDGAMVNFE